MGTTTGPGINDLLRDHREAILRLAESYNATNVRVFGSVARGEARPDSDVEALLGRKVDVVHVAFLREEFAPQVLKDAVMLTPPLNPAQRSCDPRTRRGTLRRDPVGDGINQRVSPNPSLQTHYFNVRLTGQWSDPSTSM